MYLMKKRENQISQNAKNPMNKIENGRWRLMEEEKGKEPNGEKAGPGAAMASGFGGLGLEGMVGKEESVGESWEPEGEGKRGVISGDKAGEGESGNNEGAAEIVEVGRIGRSVVVVLLVDDTNKHGIPIKVAKRNIKLKSAINDREINVSKILLGIEIMFVREREREGGRGMKERNVCNEWMVKWYWNWNDWSKKKQRKKEMGKLVGWWEHK